MSECKHVSFGLVSADYDIYFGALGRHLLSVGMLPIHFHLVLIGPLLVPLVDNLLQLLSGNYVLLSFEYILARPIAAHIWQL